MEELNMELTVMNKRRYDELVGKITNLELEIARAHTQLEAIQNSNNQLAEIAFDESKFTDMLLERCEETAREAAKDAIDLDDIATDVVDRMDVSEDVERVVDRMSLVTKDTVNDLVEEYVNDNNLLNTDEVEEVVDDYIRHNCDFVESDVTDELRSDIDELRDMVDTLKETIVLEVLQLIANKLTAKENDNANNSRDNGLHISGTDTTSQGASMLNAPAGQ
jgi:hypothetical protein